MLQAVEVAEYIGVHRIIPLGAEGRFSLYRCFDCKQQPFQLKEKGEIIHFFGTEEEMRAWLKNR